MKVILSNEAKNNLVNIFDHIALDNPTRAYSFTEELKERMEDLELFPLSGKQVMTRGRRKRRLMFGKYKIFYKVNKKINHIEIEYIEHGAKLER